MTLPTAANWDSALTTVDSMVDEVAAVVGATTDPDLRRRALFALDRAAARLNMEGVFLYRTKEANFSLSSGAVNALSSGGYGITLPTDWGWPVQAPGEVFTSAGANIGQCQWIPYDRYWAYRDSLGSSAGIPAVITIKSDLERSAYIAPKVGGSTYNMRVQYRARVQRPSETQDIQLTEEAREALITGGIAFMIQFMHNDKPNLWAPYFEDFTRAARMAKATASRQIAAYSYLFAPESDKP